MRLPASVTSSRDFSKGRVGLVELLSGLKRAQQRGVGAGNGEINRLLNRGQGFRVVSRFGLRCGKRVNGYVARILII